MRKKKMLVALPLALVLMAGSALYVRAAEGDTSLACADIQGGTVTYTPPSQPQLAAQGLTAPGSLEFVGALGAPSCPDVTYGLVVVESGTQTALPYTIASASAPGDGINDRFAFNLEISESVGPMVCVYAYSAGSGESAPGRPTATAGIIDRAPGGPLAGEEYCLVENEGSGGSSGYN